MSREKRKSIAEQTLDILEQGSFLNKQGQEISLNAAQTYTVENTKVYRPEDSDQLLGNYQGLAENTGMSIDVTDETTLNAVRRLIREGHEDVFCLNFASAKNPGGGFLGGSQAQEESIARSTGLYPSLLTATEYYEVNRATKSCIYTDYMIYSPKVPIFKLENGDLMDELMSVSILTAPAVNAGVVRNREPEAEPKIEEVMRRRIEKVLAIALAHGHRTLVLGAWGCGVFQNDPEKMAQYFHEIITSKFAQHFQKIVFAIYSKNPKFIQPFQQWFQHSHS